MGEFGVSYKQTAAIKKSCSSFSNQSSCSTSSAVEQSLEESPFPNKLTNMMIMMLQQHQNHRHRPFSHDSLAALGDGDGDCNGPTMSFTTTTTNHNHNININAVDASASAPSVAPAISLQPFHFPPYTPTSTFNSSAGGMAASLGFPFTSAQWKELERQAMIYKYMMASVPVPPDLLMIPPSLRSPLDGGFNLRLSSSTDPEPGRCKRTDGKKWRCSRDVAPNHKYCERHMHRSRPRSRKPVEVQTNNDQQIKRARHDSNPFPTSDVTLAASISSSTTRKAGSPSSHFLASATTTQPYLESSLSLDNSGVKATNFVSSHKEPRGLDWMLNGDPISLGASDSQWQSLMQNKVASSCNNTDSHYLNSYALYSSGLDQQDRSLPLFHNPLVSPMETLQSEKPRGFIDAWSNAETGETNNNTHKNSNSASIGKLSLSSLDLSMGGGSVHEEMGLCLMDPDGNTQNDPKISLPNWLTPASWVASNPLAEVLRSSTVTPSNPSSPVITNVESNNSLSSPSGVLQKTLASFSDSSSNSSPRVASSRANSEIALLRSQSNVN